jgi:hypothetical protein
VKLLEEIIDEFKTKLATCKQLFEHGLGEDSIGIPFATFDCAVSQLAETFFNDARSFFRKSESPLMFVNMIANGYPELAPIDKALRLAKTLEHLMQIQTDTRREEHGKRA